MQIIIISGSIRTSSYTKALCQAVAQKLTDNGNNVSIWDFLESPLPMANPEYHHLPFLNPDLNVKKFLEKCQNADGIIWATPIYHNSYSGVLKNAIDLLNIEICAYKTLGLLSHGGGRTTQGVDHLRIVGRGLNCLTIPTQVCTSKEDYEFTGEKPVLTSLAISKRIERFCNEFWSGPIETDT